MGNPSSHLKQAVKEALATLMSSGHL